MNQAPLSFPRAYPNVCNHTVSFVSHGRRALGSNFMTAASSSEAVVCREPIRHTSASYPHSCADVRTGFLLVLGRWLRQLQTAIMFASAALAKQIGRLEAGNVRRNLPSSTFAS